MTETTATRNIGLMIADSARLSLAYAERLLKDIRPERFARLAVAGGQTIQSNHPAFIYGHLSIYPCRIVADLGGDADPIRPSEQYLSIFGHTAECLDDPDGRIYPSMEEITERFFTATRSAVEALQTADDSRFAEPNPNEAMRGKFATVGSMHAFYLGGHTMLHMGQMSAWRRIEGLGPA